MKKYLSFFRIRFIYGLQYRAAAYAGVATQFAWGGMILLMFAAFYKNSANVFPMTFKELSSYIWLQQAFLALFMSWYFDNDIMSSIVNGNIAYELCRPIDLYLMWFLKNMAVRASRVVLRCAPILLVAFFLPEPFKMSLPNSLLEGALFLLSLVTGFIVLVAFSMLIYITMFYTISPVGIRVLAVSTLEFLTGAIIPLPFFPEGLKKVLLILPFGSMQNTPFLIYTGVLSGSEALQSIFLQVIWFLLLTFLGKRFMKHALAKTIVQGG
ncbi:MAG TPA: ABC transporter permease [Clostridiales bacterium]|nr:ABC transporter permease [Clostridiales bacterium]